MHLYLFQDRNTGMFLATCKISSNYDLFKLPGEMNMLDTLAYSFSKEQAETWLNALLDGHIDVDFNLEEVNLKIVLLIEAEG